MEQPIQWTKLDLDESFPGDGGRLSGTQWEWHLSDSSPFQDFSREPEDWDDEEALNPRLRYAAWLKGKGYPGIYLWLLPRPGTCVEDGRFRFVHVGMSTTDVHERIREHCRNQFRRGEGRTLLCTYDRIHQLPTSGGGDEFGVLGKALWNGVRDRRGRDEWEHAEKSTVERSRVARAFLESARLILMRPGTGNDASAGSIEMIKALERVVGCAASALLQVSGADEQTTNSGMKSPCGPPGSERIVARDLNRMIEMLPEKRRQP
nr:hypothetical protein [uncultured Pseudoxanthomonas sp.]